MALPASSDAKAQVHKAAFVLEPNGPFVVQLRPTPVNPEPGELLVRVHAAGVNPVDVYRRQGLINPNYPAIYGTDASGVVEKVGEDNNGIQVGDRIFFQTLSGNPDKAGFQEFALVPSDLVAKLPANISYELGATIPLAALTAFKGLFHPSGFSLPPPFTPEAIERSRVDSSTSSILIIGGSSQVGQFTLQFASQFCQFKNIYTTASLTVATIQHLQLLGATQVISRDTSPAGLAEEINEPLGFIVDAISTPVTQGLAIELLRDNVSRWPDRNRKLVLYRNLNYPADDVPQGVSVKTPYGSSYSDLDWCRKYWSMVGSWAEEGIVQPCKVQLYEGLDKVEDAVIAVKNGVHGVKCVIKIE